MYSAVRSNGAVNGTPYQPSETCGPDSPSPRMKRPCEIWSRVAAAVPVAVGCRAGIDMIAAPNVIRSVRPASSPRIAVASCP